jgi:hypothetical protein
MLERYHSRMFGQPFPQAAAIYVRIRLGAQWHRANPVPCKWRKHLLESVLV